MKLTQHLKTQQSLAMTTDMRTSLTLLSLGPSEIAEAAEEEARRNPFLRFVPPANSGGSSAPANGGSDLRQETASDVNVADTLLHQIGLISLSKAEMTLAKELPYCIDERGFLADPIDEMCSYLDTKPGLLRAVVAKVQRAVEPAGVFAWSLKDCFRIQLEAINRCDPLMTTLLDRLDLVANQDIDGISALCGVDDEDAEEMLADIRGLRPMPLTPVLPAGTVTRDPELEFHKNSDGLIEVRLCESALPQLLSDDGLFDRIKTVEIDETAIQYYRDCYRSAAGFIIAMQKRANTILRIGQEIAATQGRFIASGRTLDRQPLTMGGLADTLGVNKSTISRAMNNCRIKTDSGVVPAADFFARPLNEENNSRTRDQALHRLSVLIRTEDPRAPHSDEVLSELLTKARFPVSRRTVAKYRGLIGVPGVYHRRVNR